MYPTLLFTVKPFCNLSVPLSAQPHLGVLCTWLNTHTMAVLHHGLYNFTVFSVWLRVVLYFGFKKKIKKLFFVVSSLVT